MGEVGKGRKRGGEKERERDRFAEKMDLHFAKNNCYNDLHRERLASNSR